MKAFVARGGGELAVDEVDLPPPTTSADETLVTVRATSLNRGNLRGIRIAESGAPIGWDIAGHDPDGRRVAGITLQGAFSEIAAAPRAWLAEIPHQLEFHVAAALPVAFVTALQVVRDVAQVKQGDRVLVTGAAGGVGLAAVQFARARGAEVTAVVSNGDKARMVSACGAQMVRVGEVGEGPYDVALDSVSGASLRSCLAALAPWGRIVLLGSSSGEQVEFEPRDLFGKSASIAGYSIFNSPYTARIGADLSEVMAMVAEGSISVHVWAKKPIDELQGTLKALDAREVVGKVVFEI